MNGDVRGLRLAVRGLWFRRSTALIVLVLATVASAASVVAPLYARAAEESILRDTLRRADALTLAVHVSVPTAGSPELGAAEDPAVAAEFVDRQLAHPAFGAPQVSYSTEVRYQPARGEFAGLCYGPSKGNWLFVNIQRPGMTLAITGPWERGAL